MPDPDQLSHVMSQATAPAFVLGAYAGFVSILLGQMTSVVERIRAVNGQCDVHVVASCCGICKRPVQTAT
jgi:hypothetical protein